MVPPQGIVICVCSQEEDTQPSAEKSNTLVAQAKMIIETALEREEAAGPHSERLTDTQLQHQSQMTSQLTAALPAMAQASKIGHSVLLALSWCMTMGNFDFHSY